MLGTGYTLVGESGPELMVGGQGAMVIPASATRAGRRGRGGGNTYNFNAPITVVANNPQQFTRALQEQSYGEARA